MLFYPKRPSDQCVSERRGGISNRASGVICVTNKLIDQLSFGYYLVNCTFLYRHFSYNSLGFMGPHSVYDMIALNKLFDR